MTSSSEGDVLLRDGLSGDSLASFSSPGYTVDTRWVKEDEEIAAVTKGNDATITFWYFPSGMKDTTINIGSVWSAYIAPKGEYYAIGKNDSSLALLDSKGKMLWEAKGHNDKIHSLYISKAAAIVVSGSYDGTAKIWDLKDGTLLSTLKGHGDEVRAVSVSDDGKMIITAGNDGTIKYWRWPLELPGKRINTAGLNLLKLSRNGNYIAYHNNDSLFVYDVLQNKHIYKDSVYKIVYQEKTKRSSINSEAISDDGNILLSVGYGFATIQNNIKKPISRDHSFNGIGFWGSQNIDYDMVTISPTKDKIAIAGGGAFELWNIKDLSNKNISLISSIKQPHDCRYFLIGMPHCKLNKMEFSPDGKRLATCGTDNIAYIINIDQIKTESTSIPNIRLVGHECYIDELGSNCGINDLVFSTSGQYLLTGGQDNTARLWDLKNGSKVIHSFRYKNGVRKVGFSHNDKYCLTVEGNNIHIWNMKYGDEFKTIINPDRGLYDLAFSPDDEFLILLEKDSLRFIPTPETFQNWIKQKAIFN